MAAIAKRYQSELDRIKGNIQEAYTYFKPNYDMWHDFHKFVFLSSLNEKEIETLQLLKKPVLECNILEAFISRLRGEFYKQEPSIEVMSEYDGSIHPDVIKVVEGHIRHILNSSNKDGCEYQVYTDMLAGGFSVIEVTTDYAHAKSMKQIIKVNRCFDPTLCGFDPLARDRHKGDGRYCFKLYPKTEDEFKEEFPEIDISGIEFGKTLEGFSWAYNNSKDNILLVGDYYEKKKKYYNIVELPNGQVITSEEYKELLANWSDITPPPVVPESKKRRTHDEVIERYMLVANQVVKHETTDFKFLPLVFCDGNSAFMRSKGSGVLQQHTRPYVYHAKGTQQLKNFAMQSLANELENMIQHKWMAAEEAIPEKRELAEAYANPQLPTTLIYKAFMDNDVDKPIPPPQAIARTQIPPEISNTLAMTDSLTQTILGSYDASLGINNNQLSGIAVVEGATQSNSAAMPYVVGFMQAWNQVAQIVLDLIPKYYVTPRTIPITTPDGKHSYQLINSNEQESPFLDYDSNDLTVKVEAGVSFAVQKDKALKSMIALMQASPLFAQFINTSGLDELLSNLDIRGIDGLREKVGQYQQMIQQQQQQQQQMQQQAMQNNPQMLRAKNEQVKMQLDAQQNQTENQLKAAGLSLQEQEIENERLRTLSQIESNQRDALVQMDKHQTERARAAADMAMQALDLKHRHTKEVHQLSHDRSELHRKIADTILKHRKHEATESPMEEMKEHE